MQGVQSLSSRVLRRSEGRRSHAAWWKHWCRRACIHSAEKCTNSTAAIMQPPLHKQCPWSPSLHRRLGGCLIAGCALAIDFSKWQNLHRYVWDPLFSPCKSMVLAEIAYTVFTIYIVRPSHCTYSPNGVHAKKQKVSKVSLIAGKSSHIPIKRVGVIYLTQKRLKQSHLTSPSKDHPNRNHQRMHSCTYPDIIHFNVARPLIIRP